MIIATNAPIHSATNSSQKMLFAPIGRFSARLILLASATFLWADRASAHDHSHPDLSAWFHGLHSTGGGPCCNGSDVDKAEAVWDAQGGHYRAKDPKGEWRVVPDDRIVRGQNRAGYAMVWWFYVNGVYAVRCFLPGVLS